MKIPKLQNKKLKRYLPWLAGALVLVLLLIAVTAIFVLNRPEDEVTIDEPIVEETEEIDEVNEPEAVEENDPEDSGEDETPKTISAGNTYENVASTEPQNGNCTVGFGNLMLINANFTVETGFITARRGQLVSLTQTYGIPEYRTANGDNLLTAEAASHLNEMLQAYAADYPGHQMGTRSCFRAQGTSCGRMCAATGTSDHHTGLTCDLIDQAYGDVLDTDYYANHPEWQWLRENSYKYGFIDRYPEAWAGSSMAEPMRVDANGTTGYYESWHYRYVGVTAATEIATGKYNGGRYDSLEHYLKATGRVADLVNGRCQ